MALLIEFLANRQALSCTECKMPLGNITGPICTHCKAQFNKVLLVDSEGNVTEACRDCDPLAVQRREGESGGI